MIKGLSKKIVVSILVVLGLFLAFNFIQAQGISLELGEESGLIRDSLPVIAARIINAGLGILGLIAVAIVLYGGYLYMTARGEAERVQKAKKLLIQAVIGLLIISSAFAITSFVIYLLSGGGRGFDGNGNRNIIPPSGCVGPECDGRFPTSWCENPSPGSNDPYICSINPSQQGKGGILTIRGGNFGSYDSQTSRISFLKDSSPTSAKIYGTILSCGENNYIWNLNDSGIIKVAVPDALEFDSLAGANNKYRVYVENAGATSIDYRLESDFTSLRNIFTLINKTPSPEMLCILPDNGAESADIEILGRYMGSGNDNKVIFNKNIEAVSVTSWSQDSIKLKVPQSAIHGDVFIAEKSTNKKLSDVLNFWVTCSSTSSPYDCQSNCCRNLAAYGGNVCDLQKYCRGQADIGGDCNSNQESGAVCSADTSACVEGLTCDNVTCKCRLSKAGDSCDGNSATASCEKNNELCGQEFVCDNDCKCRDSIKITAVIPDNGAPGNYITISGKGFGSPNLGQNFIPNSGFSTNEIFWSDAYQPAPKGPVTTMTNGQLSIDASQASAGSWYIMFAYRDIGRWMTNKNLNTKYLLSFKFKGNVPAGFNMSATVNLGDNKPNITGVHSRDIGAPIQPGNYTEWQTFNGVFTYDKEMKEEYYLCVNESGALQPDCSSLRSCIIANPATASTACENFKRYKIDLGFLIYTMPRDMKIFIDDFEVKEIKSIGKVDFCGEDKDSNNNKCGDSDDVIAKLPFEANSYCMLDNVWTDNQIIVVAPSSASNINGPIQVTTASGLSAQTDSFLIDDFEFNNISRPSLCSINPSQGKYNDRLRAYGNAFGNQRGTVIYGNPADNKTFTAPGTWTSQLIAYLFVPNLRPALLPVWVKVGNELSNPLAIRVLPTAATPVINSIDPLKGQTGQYITIAGSGFGARPGTVNFWVSGAGTVSSPYVWTPGLHDFPAVCAANYWTDNQIIIKVPAGANNKSLPNAATFVPGSLMVLTSDNIQSNIFDFNHCADNDPNCPLAPGICAIEPSKGPLGSGNIVVYGDNFGNYGANSSLIFSSNKATLNLEQSGVWTDKQIGIVRTKDTVNKPVLVPQGAVSGPVFLTNANGVSSNKLNFDVVDCRVNPNICDKDTPCCLQTGTCLEPGLCVAASEKSCEYRYTFKTAVKTITYGAPQVVENYACNNEINQSPSPWKNPTNSRDYACVNSLIYARFSMEMNKATFTNANIILKSCSADAQGNLISDSCTTDVALSQISDADISNNDFSIAPAENLLPNTWYQVTLKDNISSAPTLGGQRLDGDKQGGAGGDYVWNFKTGASSELCPIDSVNVTPNKALINKLSQVQEYVGRARATNCNILNSNAYSWNWYKRYCPDPSLLIDTTAETMCLRGDRESAESLNLGGLAKISQTAVGGKIIGKQIATPLTQGGLYIGAEVNNKSDDTNVLNINLNLPVITDFSPKDGLINNEVNAYVDIAGFNFGNAKGNSKVYFEKSSCPAGQTICWTEAQIDKCGQAWTDTSVKVIVPKDVKDGAWIKLVTPFGEVVSDFNKNNFRDIGEIFVKSENIYPFICQLNPNVGTAGINVTVSGDNFGDSHITRFNNVQYGLASYINFNPFNPAVLPINKIKNWSNISIGYENPLDDLDVSSVKVFATIDPYSEPYNDLNNNGVYDADEPYADTDNNGAYTKFSYTVNGQSKSNLESNRVDFYQPPTITRLSPDNGPIRQWVTIIGKNFGNEEGEVYFGNLPAELVSCETPVWTDKYIIVEVPAGAVTGNVYIITAKQVKSNDKIFRVNSNPLGAGLCSLDPVLGSFGDPVNASGVRFGDAQNNSSVNFGGNIPATEITAWSDTDITFKVPVNAESGDVRVIKKVQIGEKCAGFSVGGWCPNNQYEPVYQDAPSNGLNFIVDTEEPGYCITASDCLIANRCENSICQDNQCTPEIISVTPVSGPVGQWVDIEGCYLGCRPGKVIFYDQKEALVPSDNNGLCNNTWLCSRNLSTAYDMITVEVPNKNTVITSDDAETGNVTLQTSKGYQVDLGNFIVSGDTLPQQICKLKTCGNGVLDENERCEIINTEFVIADAYNDCSRYRAPENCVIKCNDKCSILVCDSAGQNCTVIDSEISTCGNGAVEAGEDCDFDTEGSPILGNNTCSSLRYGTGTLGCYGTNALSSAVPCKFDASACSQPPDITPPFVEKTLPAHGVNNFCRNGIIDIYFSELLDPASITPENFVLGSCEGGLMVRHNDSVLSRALAYLKNVIFKLAGYKTRALAEAEALNCDDLQTFSPDDYNVTYSNIIDNKVAKTVVYIELTDQLLKAGKNFNVGIVAGATDKDGKFIPAVKDKAGNALDISNTPLAVNFTESVLQQYDIYAFGFTTAGNPLVDGSGICDADKLDIYIYNQAYATDAERVSVLADEFNPADLFRCAGKNDCALEAGNTVSSDYDQDRQTSGNQHIYKANVYSSANQGGYHLSIYSQWSRSGQSDPAGMLTIFNKTADEDIAPNVVRNRSGVVYATINKIADKENTGLLLVEAQSKGSQSDPEYKILQVDYIGCDYPWIFDRDAFSNSKIWYCRDGEPLLPDAGILTP